MAITRAFIKKTHQIRKQLLFALLGIIFFLPKTTYAQFEKGILLEGLVTTDFLITKDVSRHFGCSAGFFGRYLFENKVPSNRFYIEANLELSRLVGLPIAGEDCSKRDFEGDCYSIVTSYQIDYLILYSLSGGVKTNIRNFPLQASAGIELSHFPDLWRHPNGVYGTYRQGTRYTYNKNALNILLNLGMPINKVKFIDSIFLSYRHPKYLHVQNSGFNKRKQLSLAIKFKI